MVEIGIVANTVTDKSSPLFNLSRKTKRGEIHFLIYFLIISKEINELILTFVV